MNTIMNDHHLKTLGQVRAFLDGTEAVEFSLDSKVERYDFIRRTLIRFAYQRLSKPDKGLLLNFMTHVSGYSRIQVKRLTKTWLKRGQLQPPLQCRQWLYTQIYGCGPTPSGRVG